MKNPAPVCPDCRSELTQLTNHRYTCENSDCAILTLTSQLDKEQFAEVLHESLDTDD